MTWDSRTSSPPQPAAAGCSRRRTCRLCGGTDHDLVLPLAPAPIVDAYIPADRLEEPQPSYPLDLFLCRGCGHAQLLDVVDPKLLYVEYLYVTTSSLGLPEHFARYAEDVMRRIKPSPGALVVDIGSNDGTLLKAFTSHGMRVLGIDPAREIARAATAAGLETLPIFFTAEEGRRLRQERGPAAVVTVNNLFANVDDLEDMTAGIREWLAPDGVFVFESFYLADLIQNMVFDFIYHEHLSAFSVTPLEAFFRRMGLELIDVQRVPTKGGSLRYTVQRAGGPRPVAASVGELKAHEARIGLHRRDIFEAFVARIDAIEAQLMEAVRALKVQGKRLAGYGASATSTVLLYHFGLREVLDFIADDNPDRQGRFSPGCHLPVVAPAALYERRPDAVVILAWRYVEPILGKHQAFLDQGGEFIVPLPRVHRISQQRVSL